MRIFTVNDSKRSRSHLVSSACSSPNIDPEHGLRQSISNNRQPNDRNTNKICLLFALRLCRPCSNFRTQNRSKMNEANGAHFVATSRNKWKLILLIKCVIYIFLTENCTLFLSLDFNLLKIERVAYLAFSIL